MELLAPRRGERVLDVGSGIGKFCVVGALSTESIFVGVEQRRQLVRQAYALAQRLGAGGALFLCRDAFAVDWRRYAAIYLYNPFGELEFEPYWRLDSTVKGGVEAYKARVAGTRRKLERLRVGTRVVTFHGFGGAMPESFTPVSKESLAGGELALWVRTGDPAQRVGPARNCSGR
ncbi:MAG: hypothetical protein IPJ65_27230 [Archangiaceae bacterium]|nr:hypothetical protein [Archangiaceae bacterium]